MAVLRSVGANKSLKGSRRDRSRHSEVGRRRVPAARLWYEAAGSRRAVGQMGLETQEARKETEAEP